MTTTTKSKPGVCSAFDSEVHQAYQGNAVLQNVCRMRTGVVGNTVNFPKIGKDGQPCEIADTDVVPLNTAFTSVSVSMSDFVASSIAISSCKLKLTSTSVGWQLCGVPTIGRRQDRIIIDAINAASAGSTVAKTVVTTRNAAASNLNVGKILAAKKGSRY